MVEVEGATRNDARAAFGLASLSSPRAFGLKPLAGEEAFGGKQADQGGGGRCGRVMEARGLEGD